VSLAPRAIAGRALLVALIAASPACGASAVAQRRDALPAPADAGAYGVEPPLAPSRLEAAATEAVRDGLLGRDVRVSTALATAARALARGAAAGIPDPLSPVRVRAALAAGFSFDPAPVAHLASGAPESVVGVLRRAVSPVAGASHLGVGAAERAGRAHVVALVVRRSAALDPFPRDVAPGTTATLQGRLLGLSRPTVHVTGPSGDSRTVSTSAPDERFAAPVRFDAGGRWRVEVVGSGPRGPEVAALLTVRCGAAAPDDGDAAADPPDPADDRAAEARVVSAINALRERQGLPPLEPSTAVAEVARRHSAAMLSTGILAHRLPGSDGAGERLRRARVPFALVLENVAKGPTAMAAHRLAEESPAHRQNLLSRDATRIGVGIARGALPGGERIVYVTELMVEPVRSGDGDRVPPRARVLEALQRARARAGAPALDADPALDALALGAARAMLRNGEPAAMGLADAALDRGRRVAAADAFVATRPGEAARSRHVTDPRYGRVGVGVLVGDSPRFGSGLLWIAVVYTD
jgi:uncharacterized protein YkwD